MRLHGKRLRTARSGQPKIWSMTSAPRVSAGTI